MLNTLIKLTCLTIFGSSIRLLLMLSSYQQDISERVEVSTPLSSWKRAIEGVTLSKHGISPYDGDTFHESPFSLLFYEYLLTYPHQYITALFIGVDVLTGLILSWICYSQLQQISSFEIKLVSKLKPSDAETLKLKNSLFKKVSIRVAAIYLLSPYSILACTGMSTGVFGNFLIALLILLTSSGYRLLSAFLVAVVGYQSLYPVLLIIPVAMILENQKIKGKSDELSLSDRKVWLSMLFTLTLMILFLIGIIFASHSLMNKSWDFLWSTYGFILTVPDFTPNIGIFWYFFTEMFDHFRDFFLWTFQINSFVYAIPLASKLRRNPFFLLFVLLVLLSLFKSYPSVSDLSLYLALLAQWSHLFKYMRQNLVVACMFASCSVLAPIVWHMWIMAGTANSNYYFGVTLAYNAAQIFLTTDLLFAFTKREFYLYNGIEKDKNGKPLGLELVCT